jgi:hypothetical protein
MRALFTVTVFFSALFLFLIEPMSAKVLLPIFGGSASVWTAAMVFFQVALLAGYAYANWLSRQGSALTAWIHLVAMAVAILLFNFTFNLTLPKLGAGQNPTAGAVAFALAKFLGLLFVALSAGAPLLQRAFAWTNDKLRATPYFLYAASNAGSLIALLAYPVLIEPRLPVSHQLAAWRWGIGFVLLATFVCLFAASIRQVPRSSAVEDDGAEVEPPDTTRPTPRQRVLWISLAAAPSSLLLGVTTFLTTSVAPIPLLWVVPLSLYLITFIVAFAHRPRVTATGVGRWLPALATPLALALILESASPIIPLALFHLATVFVAMLACHLRLSESRPTPSHLTDFYLCLAIGGAIGGLFNALIAPLLFTTLFEYPLALALCCTLAVVAKPAGGKTWERPDWRWPVGVAALTTLVLLGVGLIHMQPSTLRTILTIGVPAVVCFVASGRTIRYGLSLLALFIVAALGHVSAGGKVLFGARSFYGVHRVVEDTKHHLRKLVHGNTVHGIQSTLPSERGEPLTYYSRMGPAGMVFRSFRRTMSKPNVGLIGLGVGSLAAYGEPGQKMTFFEIDPVVIRVATDPRLFTFLSDSKATIRVIPGDGRLTMAVQPDQSFGVIVLDAFTSDSIPVHLLTREAIEMYMRKLAPHGIMLFHISNNYLDLAPILGAEARDLHLAAVVNDDNVTSDPLLALGIEPSKWLAMARYKEDLGALGHFGAWDAIAPARRGWTDDFSDILSALKLNQADTEQNG